LFLSLAKQRKKREEGLSNHATSHTTKKNSTPDQHYFHPKTLCTRCIFLCACLPTGMALCVKHNTRYLAKLALVAPLKKGVYTSNCFYPTCAKFDIPVKARNFCFLIFTFKF